MNTSELRPLSRMFILTCLVIVIVGASLSLADLGKQSLWLDEAFTWSFVRLNWPRAIQAIRADAVNPPFYYLFVKVVTSGVALNEAALRFPSALAQIIGIVAAIFLGYRLGGEAGGAAAGLLWATHPLIIWASREARPYALAAALGVGALGAFVTLRHSPSSRTSVAAVVFLALGLLTHYFFFLLVTVLILLALIDLRRSPAFFRRWTILSLIAMIPLAIWLTFYFSQFSQDSAFQRIGWIRTPHLADVPLTLWNLISGYAGVIDIASLAFGVVVIVALGLAVSFGDRSQLAGLALAGLLIPVIAVWVISQRRPVYVDRYFIVLMPLIASIVALGASAAARQLARPWARWTAVTVCALIAVSAGFSVHHAWKFDKEDWRGLAAFLESRGATEGSYSVSGLEIALPLAYYGLADVNAGLPPLVPACGSSCWWILRQPYTATHAVSQPVSEPERDEAPTVPEQCIRKDEWQSSSGVRAWEILCPANSG
ncbi:MAG: glycosyltransferase family 39 protein [Chloroflexi bacterium]|nr:glycosyltransferase family 39 protein [Chloroflexota bacterium]